ncbi:hypothetical protein HPP92_004906 [Vanilla planifolia]|uniref:Uncharacterized protein n=1 Tax=Vanilla planifolia TaxID=51239 RepID=A0A835RTI1_VANPL|nr:hypothetical protein HPP92_005251 [Vanilla planifolia]KAG0493912.1 hypothetical protein HPP92_004906 [Vanilla planifolia]
MGSSSSRQATFPHLKHVRRYTKCLLHSFSFVQKFASLPMHNGLTDISYDSFKTSGKVELQFSNQSGKSQDPGEKGLQQDS